MDASRAASAPPIPTLATTISPASPTSTELEVPRKEVEACVQYVQFGAFVGNEMLTAMWEHAERDVAQLELDCLALGRNDSAALATLAQSWSVQQAALTTVPATEPPTLAPSSTVAPSVVVSDVLGSFALDVGEPQVKVSIGGQEVVCFEIGIRNVGDSDGDFYTFTMEVVTPSGQITYGSPDMDAPISPIGALVPGGSRSERTCFSTLAQRGDFVLRHHPVTGDEHQWPFFIR